MAALADYCLFVDAARIRVWERKGSSSRFVDEFPNEKGLRSLLSSQCLPNRSKLNVFVDTDSVLFSTIPLSATGRTNQQAATYEAEPFFPIAAEDMIAVIDIGSGDTASFLVIDQNWFEPFCRSLTERGIEIQQVVPATPTIAYAAIMKSSPSANRVVVKRGAMVETLIIKNRHLEFWSCDVIQEPDRGVRGERPMEKKSAQAIETDRVDQDILQIDCHDPEVFEQTAIDSLKTISPSIKRGKVALQFPTTSQSETDSNRRPWETVAMMGCLAMLIGASIFWVRGQQYQNYAQLADQELVRLAKESFPGQRVGSLKRSLDTELQTSQRQLATWQAIVQSEGVVQTLLEFLKSVPDQPEIDFRLVELQNRLIRIEGDAKQLGTVTEFAEAFRQSGLKVNEKKYGLQFELEVVVTNEKDLAAENDKQVSASALKAKREGPSDKMRAQ